MIDQGESSATKPASDEFRCPTCGARQSWADVCRRCKCDLSLVVAGHRRRSSLRDEYLIQLRRQRADEAVRAANELHALAPDDESLRLRAVAHLLRGDFAAALQDAATAWHGLPTKRDGVRTSPAGRPNWARKQKT